MDERHKILLVRVVDVLWSCAIITPLTIFYWGGTWKLLDIYLYPHDPLISSAISLVIGTVGCIGGFLIWPLLGDCVGVASERICSLRHVLISRVMIYIMAFVVLNFWRGTWNLADHYLKENLVANGICVSIASLLLIPFRALGNVISAPFSLALDVSPSIYHPHTRFQVQASDFCLYLADCLFTQLYVIGLTVVIWWAQWNLMDAFIFPGNTLISYYVSLGIGYGCAFILFALQRPLATLAQRVLQVHWSLMFILQVLLRVVTSMVTLLIWRGGWGLNRDYLLENTLEASLAHGCGSLGLLIFQSLNTVSSLNVTVDRETTSAESFYFSIDYFKYFMDLRRQPHDLQVQERRSSVERGLLEDSDDDLLGPNTYS